MSRPPSPGDAITGADVLLDPYVGALPFGVPPSSAEGKAMRKLAVQIHVWIRQHR